MSWRTLKVRSDGQLLGAARLPDRARRFRPPRRRTAPITFRQLECLYWVQAGKSATDIGCILGVSPRTVEAHLAKACARFGVRTRIQAVLKAKALGLLPETES